MPSNVIGHELRDEMIAVVVRGWWRNESSRRADLLLPIFGSELFTHAENHATLTFRAAEWPGRMRRRQAPIPPPTASRVGRPRQNLRRRPHESCAVPPAG